MQSSDQSGGSLAGLRVLIAEDLWHIADDLRRIVERAGATVSGTAASREELVAVIEGAAYDVAVMDINLADEPVAPLVASMADSGVKVVIVSGNDVEPALAAKVVAVLSKPIEPEDLIAALAPLVRSDDGGPAD